MIKKLICLAGLVVMMSCARSTTGPTTIFEEPPENTPLPEEVTQYTSLWASVGGDEGASNTVSGRLPSLTGIEAVSSAEAGFNVYASPVIFSDDSGNQYVIALWVNDSSAKLVKYDYQNTLFTKDTDFQSETFNTNATGFKAHQISLLVSDVGVFVYVGHGDGISKVDALTGEVIISSTDRGANYSVLVYNNKVYATTETHIVEYNAFLTSSIGRSLNDTVEIPSIGFPLVVSGEFIYAAKPSTIFKIDLPSDGIGSLNDFFTVDDASSLQTETLSNIVAYNNDGVIYASKFSRSLSFDSTFDFYSTVHGFFGAASHSDGESDFEYYAEVRRRNQQAIAISSNRVNSTLGDASYSMLASAGETVYLPGMYNTYLDFESASVTPNAGPVSFIPEIVSLPENAQIEDRANSFFIPSALVILNNDFSPPNDGYDNILYYSTRFFIVDLESGSALAVQNVNETFFKASGLNEETDYKDSIYSALIVEEFSTTDKLDNYNSRIMIGNSSAVEFETFTDSSLEVDSIAVGNNMAVVSASDGKLYLIK